MLLISLRISQEDLRVPGSLLDITRYPNTLKDILHALIWRRYMECKEAKIWDYYVPKQLSTRREIYSLIIWICSNTRHSLVERQQLSLNNELYHGETAVIGWSVTEDILPCTQDSIICPQAKPSGEFMPMMPKTFLGNNSRGYGWSCAQRRPLRALSHVLLLFNPKYVILADDDTFINYPFIRQIFSSVLDEEAYRLPIVIGHYIMKKWISPKGLLFGGTGYIIGYRALKLLTSYSIRNVRTPRRDKYLFSLSLLQELKGIDKSCSSSAPCLLSNRPHNGTFPLPMRLIDICSVLMASENTCYHR